MASKKNQFGAIEQFVGKNVYLKPATPDDVANTWHWFAYSRPEQLSPSPHPILTASQASEQYKSTLGSETGQRFMVVRQTDKTPVGWIEYSELNQLNRSARLEIMVDPDERKHKFASEATRLLCHYLFQNLGLNKVYTDVCEDNKAGIALLKSLGFSKDGIYRGHYFFKNEFHDAYHYAVMPHEMTW